MKYQLVILELVHNCDGNDKTNQFFSIIQCHNEIGSVPNCDGNGNGKMGIRTTGGGVHTVIVTENKEDLFNLLLLSQCERAFICMKHWVQPSTFSACCKNDRVTCKQSSGRILPQCSCLPGLLIVLIPPRETPVPD